MAKHDKTEPKELSVRKPGAAPRVKNALPLEDNDVQESLERIYRTDTGEMPNFGRFDRARRSFWLRVVVGIGVAIVFLCALAWTGLFALQPLKQPGIAGLAIALHEPQEVTLGKEEELTIEWSNESLQPLAEADIRLTLPPEFQLLSSDPTPTDAKALRWDLGLVSPHGSGVIRLKGLFLGTLGETGTIQAIGNFRNQNTDRDRQVVVSQTTNYHATVLEGALSLPENVLPGDTVVMQYSLKNTGTKPLEQLVARVAIPDGFLPTASTTIDAETRTLEFRIGSLPSQSLTTIQLPGHFAPGVGGDATFVVQAGQLQSGQFFPIQQTEKRIAVLAGELALHIVANGTSESSLQIAPGEPLRVLAEYQNTSPELLKNISFTWNIEALIDGKVVAPNTLIDLASISSDPVAVSTTKPRLLSLQYEKKQIPLLETLAPGARGRIELLLPTILPTKSLKQAMIRVTAQSQIGSIGSTLVNRKITFVPLLAQYKSDANVKVETRYYTEEGAPLGSGPLPPVVGKTTSYRVFWSVQKKLHALEELDVVAHLPRIVAWGQKNQSDTGTLTFDPQTREVRWHVKTIPEDVHALQASFEVQLTPEVIDVGRFATLLEETSFRAHDVIANEWLTQQKPIQTTDLQNDEAAKSKGVVRKP